MLDSIFSSQKNFLISSLHEAHHLVRGQSINYVPSEAEPPPELTLGSLSPVLFTSHVSVRAFVGLQSSDRVQGTQRPRGHMQCTIFLLEEVSALGQTEDEIKCMRVPHQTKRDKLESEQG